jgi:hypothetical protein
MNQKLYGRVTVFQLNKIYKIKTLIIFYTMNKSDEQIKIIENFTSRYQETTENENKNDGGTCDNRSDNNNSNLPPLPFDDPLQQVVLLNITHRQQFPKSKIPGFRICGAFKNTDKLKDHVKQCGEAAGYGGAHLFKADIHKKFIMCSSVDKQKNPQYVMQKIEDISKKYITTIQFHNDEFTQNKKNHRQGKTGLSQHEKPKKTTTRRELLDKKFDEESSKGQESGEISRTIEVRRQTVAVVTMIEDTTPGVLNGLEDPEPIVIVWGCFEDDKTAKHYIYNTASKFVKDVMLDVVNMYEWIYPSEVAKRVDEIDEEFRNSTLNKVMQARKVQKSQVLSYEEWCKKENQQPSVLEIKAYKENENSEVKTDIIKSEPMVMNVMVMDNKLEVNSNDPHVAIVSPPTLVPPKKSAPLTDPHQIFDDPTWKSVQNMNIDPLYQSVVFK